MKTGFYSIMISLVLLSGLAVQSQEKPRIIFDTDANNELDDQHALAYLLFNGDHFYVEGVTVNRTRNGGPVENHYAEAMRVVKLCGLEGTVPVITGASGSFEEIAPNLEQEDFDGAEAVQFIIDQAQKTQDQPLILLPVGKLTNVALALKKAPQIAGKVRIVWLGSNYPDPGEYNQDNDVAAMNYLLDQEVAFEIALVRYGKPSGTDAVRVTPAQIDAKMPGKGPQIEQPVEGRHGSEFTNFGDYSVSLFEHANMYGDPPSRALFDMAAVAIVKNPRWANAVKIPAPIYQDGQWVERPENQRFITLWQNFHREAILEDFFARMSDYQLAHPAP